MLTFEKEIEINSPELTIDADTVMFDIETTGFSSRSTYLYLIGAIYLSGGRLILRQWFAENKQAEAAVLASFFEVLNGHSKICGYNSNGFDIPYINERCRHYNLPYTLDAYESIDIFRLIKPLSALLKLPNYKQKSIEHFLGTDREDIYSGGELIKIYEKYVNAPDKAALDTILLHNSDDLKGLLAITPVLSYLQITDGSFTVASLDLNRPDDNSCEAVFSAVLDHPVPSRVSCGNEDYYMSAYANVLKLRCCIYTGELKYFYSDYTNYYYLPFEDRAIHKSVAFYVDKDFRTKAKAATCYSKKTGMFLPQKSEIISPYFKIDYSDKKMYFELDDTFRSSYDSQYTYMRHIIASLLRQHNPAPCENPSGKKPVR